MISFRDAPATVALTLHARTLGLVCPPQYIRSLQTSVTCRNSTLLRKRAISCCSLQEPSSARTDPVNKPSTVAQSSAVDTASSFVTREDLKEKVEIPDWKQPDDQKQLSQVWREIQGENQWEGLLDHPIDPILRSELIRYGEFTQATYDAFDCDSHSKYCGSCKYSRKRLLHMVEKEDCGYEVTKYLYATSNLDLPKFFLKAAIEEDRWSQDSNWIGYIAVATDKKEIERLGRRDILVAWRGTVTKTEWIDDILDAQIPADFEPGKNQFPDVKVATGFRILYVSSKEKSRYNKLSARQQLQSEIQRLLEQFEGEELSITITGHSLGGALALLSAYDIAAGNSNVGHGRSPSSIPITVFSFSAPRVGNRAFKERVNELGVKVLRVLNVHDVVPKVPGFFLNEALQWRWIQDLVDDRAYHHTAQQLKVDCYASPHLKQTGDLPSHHNLEAHLHLLDGYHGEGKEFRSVFGRSPILVNKSSDFLKTDMFIPPSWYQDRNKGLMRNEKGEWVLPVRLEKHRPENH